MTPTETATTATVPEMGSAEYWEAPDTSDLVLIDGGYTPPLFPNPLSAGRRLTLRQREQIAEGEHPISGGPLHPRAPADAGPKDRCDRPVTCGTCVFLTTVHVGSKTPYKCGFAFPERITHGQVTTVVKWWPGCTDYAPKKAR